MWAAASDVVAFLLGGGLEDTGGIAGRKGLRIVGGVDFLAHLVADVVQEFGVAVIAQALREAHDGGGVHADCVGKLGGGHEGDFVIVAHDEIGNLTVAAAQVFVVIPDTLSIHGKLLPLPMGVQCTG
jgi:hypothetical protein